MIKSSEESMLPMSNPRPASKFVNWFKNIPACRAVGKMLNNFSAGSDHSMIGFQVTTNAVIGLFAAGVSGYLLYTGLKPLEISKFVPGALLGLASAGCLITTVLATSGIIQRGAIKNTLQPPM